MPVKNPNYKWLSMVLLSLAFIGFSGCAERDQTQADAATARLKVLSESMNVDDIMRIRALIKTGADVNAAKTNGVTPLWMASQNVHADIVKLLLESKADINARKNNGVTALMIASAKGHNEIALLLIDKGADVTAVNALGHTALTMARSRGHAEIVELLVKALQSYLSARLSEGMPISPSELLEYYEQVKAGRFIKTARVHIRLIDIRPSDLKSS